MDLNIKHGEEWGETWNIVFFHGFTWIIYGFMWKMVISPCGSNQNERMGKLTPWIHLQPLLFCPQESENGPEWAQALLTTHKVGPFFVTHFMYFNVKLRCHSHFSWLASPDFVAEIIETIPMVSDVQVTTNTRDLLNKTWDSRWPSLQCWR